MTLINDMTLKKIGSTRGNDHSDKFGWFLYYHKLKL